MPRCFILNRVSTDKQRDNLSISLQRDLHPRIAEQLGCTLSKQDVFDLDVSSTTYDRDKWNAVKAAIASGRYANGFGIFGSIDRYHRDKDEWFEFLTHCLRQKITVVIPDTSSSVPKGQLVPIEEYNPDKFKDLIQLVFEIEEAENFKKKLRSKVKRALSHARASGIDIAATGRPTLGIEWDPKPQVIVGGRGYGRWRVNKAQAAIVREIFTSPLSNVQMAKKLNQKGVKNVMGNDFDTSSISRIRKRLRYAGKIKTDTGEIIDTVNVDPIVTYDEFKSAQVHGRRLKEYRGRNAKYLMVGMVKCGFCLQKGMRGIMARKPWLNARPEQVRMYCDSTRYLPKEQRCEAFSKGISGDRIFQLVRADLQMKLKDKRILSKAIADYNRRIEQSKDSGRADRLTKQISTIDRKLQNLTKAVSEGYDSSLAIREMTRLRDERETIAQDLAALSAGAPESAPKLKDLQVAGELLFSKNLSEHLPVDRVNSLLKFFVTSVESYIEHIIIRYKFFGDVTIKTPYIDYRYRANRSPLYKRN